MESSLNLRDVGCFLRPKILEGLAVFSGFAYPHVASIEGSKI